MGYAKHNRTFWRQLDKFDPVDMGKIEKIMLNEGYRYKELIREAMPELYGGFKDSIYCDISYSDTRINLSIGIPATLHENRGNEKGIFTNTKLAGWLTVKENKPAEYVRGKGMVQRSTSKEDMVRVRQLLNECGKSLQNKINQYWKWKGSISK